VTSSSIASAVPPTRPPTAGLPNIAASSKAIPNPSQGRPGTSRLGIT